MKERWWTILVCIRDGYNWSSNYNIFDTKFAEAVNIQQEYICCYLSLQGNVRSLSKSKIPFVRFELFWPTKIYITILCGLTKYDFVDFFIIIISFCEAIGTAATPGLLCQPRVIAKMIVEKQMECKLAEETEVLGENLHRRHFCPSQNPTWPDPGLNPGRRGGKPAFNRLSYGAAMIL
jgi:hypothetical protein